MQYFYLNTNGVVFTLYVMGVYLVVVSLPLKISPIPTRRFADVLTVVGMPFKKITYPGTP